MEKYVKPSIIVDYEKDRGILPALAAIGATVTKAAMAGASIGIASKDMYSRNIKGFKLQTI